MYGQGLHYNIIISNKSDIMLAHKSENATTLSKIRVPLKIYL